MLANAVGVFKPSEFSCDVEIALIIEVSVVDCKKAVILDELFKLLAI